MSKLAAVPAIQSPLHSFSLAFKARAMDASCGVWANEMPLQGYISLRGNIADAAFAAATHKALAHKLPTEPCTYSQSDGMTALWLSPDEWMIIVTRDSHAGLLERLRSELAGIRSQVVDNSGGYTQVIVQGPNARDVLSHCTVYNLDHLSDGRIVGTTFGKSSAYLRQEGDGYCILLRRSFAHYIWQFLERAASPYGMGILKIDPGNGVARQEVST